MTMTYGIIVIGDEILSGRRTDRHLAKTIELLSARGEQLKWAHYLGDDITEICSRLQQTMQQESIVFCFGGIGATPDDMTRQAAAKAADVALERHPEAQALIEERFGEEAYPTRILMADLPQGCELVPNPYNQIPGFQVGKHFFLPGFPVMAHPMLEWILETHFPIEAPKDYVESTLYIHDTPESSLVQPMQRMTETHPKVRFFSLPIHQDSGIRRIEFGAKGPAKAVAAAMLMLKSELDSLGFHWTDQ